MMSYRTYVRYLYVILSEIPHIKFGMTHYRVSGSVTRKNKYFY